MQKQIAVAICLAALPAFMNAASLVRVSGHYSWGHEVESFQPCGSTLSFWVVGDQALLQPLRDKAAQLSAASGEPYQPIHVEIIVVSEGKAKDGFAADYNGVYRVTGVHSVSAVSPPNCKAHG